MQLDYSQFISIQHHDVKQLGSQSSVAELLECILLTETSLNYAVRIDLILHRFKVQLSECIYICTRCYYDVSQFMCGML